VINNRGWLDSIMFKKINFVTRLLAGFLFYSQ